jgi:hypothetical protein
MLKSSVDYIMLRDTSYPGFAIYSGGKNSTVTAQFPPPPPGVLAMPRYGDYLSALWDRLWPVEIPML